MEKKKRWIGLPFQQHITPIQLAVTPDSMPTCNHPLFRGWLQYAYVPVQFVKLCDLSEENCPVSELIDEIRSKGVIGSGLRFISRPPFGDPSEFKDFSWYETKN